MSKVGAPPSFSIVVCITDQNAQWLPFTMDSIAGQTSGSYEVIVIDGQAKEHSLSVFDAYLSRIAHIHKADGGNLSVMMNKGIELSQGTYLHFLQPGEFYISRNSLHFLEEFLNTSPAADLIYTGCVVRHSLTPPQQLFQSIDLEGLKEAKIPHRLEAYWFRREAFLGLGGCNASYRIQGGLDLVCRFFLHTGLHRVFMKRILTDYEYQLPKPKWILRQLYETVVIVFHHFGFSKAVFFWIAQNHLRFFRWGSKSIKGAFWKNHSKEFY
jgi:glycosyltransferase involved in cell wall biosynthesis